MLNYVWAGMLLIGFVVSFFSGRIDIVTTAFLENAKSGVDLCINMLGIICFWSGIMEIANRSGSINRMACFLQPLIKKLFKNIPADHPAASNIFMNISANLLGLGNAATPLGLKAMEELQNLNENKEEASDDMCMFVVLNTAAFQLIPTSIIALRTNAGSVNPMEVVPYIWISSIVGCFTAITLCKLSQKYKKVHKRVRKNA